GLALGLRARTPAPRARTGREEVAAAARLARRGPARRMAAPARTGAERGLPGRGLAREPAREALDAADRSELAAPARAPCERDRPGPRREARRIGGRERQARAARRPADA